MDVEELKIRIEQDVRGVWKPDHTDDEHFYVHQPSGTRVRSVTGKSIIEKPHLIRWASRLSAEYMAEHGEWLGENTDSDTVDQLIRDASLAYQKNRDDAASVGTKVHEILETAVNYEINDWDDDSWGYSYNNHEVIAAAKAGRKALDEEPIEPAAAELTVGSTDLEVAGTLDLLCLWGGDLTIVDWKTSNSMSDTYALQIATYGGLFEEMTGLSIDEHKIIKLNKDRPSYQVYELQYPRRAYAAAKRDYKISDYLDADYKKLVKPNSKSIEL